VGTRPEISQGPEEQACSIPNFHTRVTGAGLPGEEEAPPTAKPPPICRVPAALGEVVTVVRRQVIQPLPTPVVAVEAEATVIAVETADRELSLSVTEQLHP
jgi:hypothetical protein